MNYSDLNRCLARSLGSARAWRQSGYDGLSAVLFIVAFVLVLATFRDYGVTWDEDVHFAYGYHVVDYYTSLFHDRTALSWRNLYYYGAGFDALTVLLAKVSPFGAYETRHLLNALVGLAGIAGCRKLARHLAGPRAGFWAAALLLLTPDYYGHMFNNPKDIPFAAASMWALYYIVRLLPAVPRVAPSLAVRLGIAIGLALGIRVGGLLSFCYLALAVGTLVLWRAWQARDARLIAVEGGASVLRIALPVVLVAYPIMLLCWPWAQLDPIGNPLRALAEFSQHPFPYRTLFAGKYYYAAQLPLDYLPVHVVLKLPEIILALLAVALFFAIRQLVDGRQRAERVIGFGLVGFAVVFPIAYAMAIHAVLFDGMRHFLFVLPPIAVLAGIALDHTASRLPRPWATRSAGGALAVWLTLHISLMVRLHPDQYVYYNSLIGGVPGAAGHYKLDYWANSYDEAVHGLVALLQKQDGAHFAERSYHVAVCGPLASATYYFPKNFIYESDWHRADFYVAFTKDNCNKSVPGREIYRVERVGTLLSAVLDLRGRTGPQTLHAASDIKGTPP